MNKKPKVVFSNFKNNWKIFSFYILANIFLSGGTPSTKEPTFWSGTIPWIQSSDIQKDILFGVIPQKFISEEGLQKSSAKLIPKNSIAIVTRVGVGKLAIIDQDYATSQDFLSLSDINGDTQFIVYSIYRMLQKESTQLQGTSIKGITKEDILSKKISLPEIEEQSAIGSLFRTLDDLLARYKENLANYQSLKTTMLSKMFPKAGQTVPEIRLDGFEGEWKEKEFSKLVKRVTQSSDSDSLPKVEFEDIISGQGKLNKDISTKFDNRKGIHFKPGYTLYGKLRPYLNNWLLPKFEGVALGDFWVFDPNRNDSNFIYYLVQSNRYQKVANDTSGTKMPRSDWKSVSTTIFAIPQTIAEQQAIGAYFSNLDNLINSHQEKISQLETLKKKLLQDMFI